MWTLWRWSSPFRNQPGLITRQARYAMISPALMPSCLSLAARSSSFGLMSDSALIRRLRFELGNGSRVAGAVLGWQVTGRPRSLRKSGGFLFLTARCLSRPGDAPPILLATVSVAIIRLRSRLLLRRSGRFIDRSGFCILRRLLRQLDPRLGHIDQQGLSAEVVRFVH